MRNFDRSDKKRVLVNLRPFAKRHMLLAATLSLSIMLFSCTKSKVMPVITTTPPQVITNSTPTVKYVYTSNPNITISTYVCSYNRIDTSYFVGKLYGSKSGTYSFAGYDKLYVRAQHDSLYLSHAGIYHLLTNERLDFNILATDDSITYSKPVTIIPDEFAKNRVIAHMGAYYDAGLPQNSLAALKQTFALGCQGSEFDVHMTVDNVLVICHDYIYGGYEIEKATYAQLNKTKLANGENLPLLKDFLLATIQQRKTKLDLEIKPSSISKVKGIELGDSILSMVHQLKAQAWIHYISFDYDILKRIHTRDLGSQCAFLVYGTNDVATNKLVADGIGMDYCYSDLVTNKITGRLNECVNAGLYVSVWTVDTPALMKDVLSNCPKISAIVTNAPISGLIIVPKL